MKFDKDYYEILGVLPSAEDFLIKAAYKVLVQKYHPDKLKDSTTRAKAEAKMKALNEAYAVLSDAKKRKKYDEYLKQYNRQNEYYKEEPVESGSSELDNKTGSLVVAGKVLGVIVLLIVIAFASGIGEMVGKSTGERYNKGKKKGALEVVLSQVMRDINSKAPMMVDSVTRLDNAVGIGNILRYNFTLLEYTASDITAESINTALENNIKINVCHSMKILINMGVTISYAYYGNKGREITVISISPYKCKYKAEKATFSRPKLTTQVNNIAEHKQQAVNLEHKRNLRLKYENRLKRIYKKHPECKEPGSLNWEQTVKCANYKIEARN